MKCAIAFLTSIFSLFHGVHSLAGNLMDATGLSMAKNELTKPRPVLVASPVVGEPHGSAFSDETFANDHDARLVKLIFTGCGIGEHLTSIQTEFVHILPQGGKENKLVYNTTPIHGKASGHSKTMELLQGEKITQVILTTYRAKTGLFHKSRRTRVGAIMLHTDQNQVFTCGSTSLSDPSKIWSFDKHALLYLKGSAGDAIDALQGEFIPLSSYAV